MTLLPHFVQLEVDAGDNADLLSAYNFCNPFDQILPISDGDISVLDMQHLWGLYTGVPASSEAPTPPPTPNEAQREPVSGGTNSSWPTKQDYRDKKKRRILEDDEEFMRIAQEALPHILSKYLN